MTLPEAIELVVSRTGHERFHWLCSDANPDAASREAYRALVLRMACGQMPAPPETPSLVPLAESNRLLQLIRECPHKGPPGCGCSGSAHCSRLDRDVTRHECFSCVQESHPCADPAAS